MKHHLCRPDLNLITMLFGLAIFLCGCSSSYTVSSAGKPNSEYSYQEMNEELTGRDVNIELKDGRDISAKEVIISEDSVSWVDAHSDSMFSIITAEVKTVARKNPWVGGAKGFGIGFIPGAVLGFAAGSSLNRDFGGSGAAPALAVVFGSATGVIGGLVGLIVGHKYEYHLVNRADSTKTK